MKTIRNIGMEEFIEIMTHYSPMSYGTALSILIQATETLGELVEAEYSVSINKLSTFKATVGLKRFKEKDSLDGDVPERMPKTCV